MAIFFLVRVDVISVAHFTFPQLHRGLQSSRTSFFCGGSFECRRGGIGRSRLQCRRASVKLGRHSEHSGVFWTLWNALECPEHLPSLTDAGGGAGMWSALGLCCIVEAPGIGREELPDVGFVVEEVEGGGQEGPAGTGICKKRCSTAFQLLQSSQNAVKHLLFYRCLSSFVEGLGMGEEELAEIGCGTEELEGAERWTALGEFSQCSCDGDRRVNCWLSVSASAK